MIYPVPYRDKVLYVRVGDPILYRNEFVAIEPMTYVSTGVRFFTGCYVNHTAIVSVDEAGELVLIEALGRGLVQRPLKDVLDRSNSYIVHLTDRREFDREAFALRLRAKVGTKYDYRNLILEQPPYRASIALGKVVDRLTGGHIALKPLWLGRTGEAEAKRLQCAEAWAWAREEKNFWLYSSKEILQHSQLEVRFFEMK